ncbi:hypothetical protein AB0J20_24170 [Micromonospora costi]
MEAVHAESDHFLLLAQQVDEVVRQAGLSRGVGAVDGHSQRV